MLYFSYIHSDVLSLDLYGDYRTLTGVDLCRRRAAPMTGSARNRLWYLPTSALCYLPLVANTLKKNSTAVLGDAAITHIRVFVSAIETTRARSLPGYGRRSDVTAYRDTRLDAVARY